MDSLPGHALRPPGLPEGPPGNISSAIRPNSQHAHWRPGVSNEHVGCLEPPGSQFRLEVMAPGPPGSQFRLEVCLPGPPGNQFRFGARPPGTSREQIPASGRRLPGPVLPGPPGASRGLPAGCLARWVGGCVGGSAGGCPWAPRCALCSLFADIDCTSIALYSLEPINCTLVRAHTALLHKYIASHSWSHTD